MKKLTLLLCLLPLAAIAQTKVTPDCIIPFSATANAHDLDIKRVEQEYVRRDVNDISDRELRDWLKRIESKLDERNRRDHGTR